MAFYRKDAERISDSSNREKEGIVLPNSTIPPRRTRKKKRSRFWTWLLVLLCFVGAAVAGAMFASSSLLDKTAGDAVEEGLLTAKDKSTIKIGRSELQSRT